MHILEAKSDLNPSEEWKEDVREIKTYSDSEKILIFKNQLLMGECI